MDTDTASTHPLPQPPHLTKRRVSFAEALAVRPKLKEIPVDYENSRDESEAMEKRDRDAIKAAAGGWEIERSIYKKKAGSRSKGEEPQLSAVRSSSSSEEAARRNSPA